MMLKTLNMNGRGTDGTALVGIKYTAPGIVYKKHMVHVFGPNMDTCNDLIRVDEFETEDAALEFCSMLTDSDSITPNTGFFAN